MSRMSRYGKDQREDKSSSILTCIGTGRPFMIIPIPIRIPIIRVTIRSMNIDTPDGVHTQGRMRDFVIPIRMLCSIPEEIFAGNP